MDFALGALIGFILFVGVPWYRRRNRFITLQGDPPRKEPTWTEPPGYKDMNKM